MKTKKKKTPKGPVILCRGWYAKGTPEPEPKRRIVVAVQVERWQWEEPEGKPLYRMRRGEIFRDCKATKTAKKGRGPHMRFIEQFYNDKKFYSL